MLKGWKNIALVAGIIVATVLVTKWAMKKKDNKDTNDTNTNTDGDKDQ